jgi:DNA-binding NarL/FixJ family response regulator
MATDDWQPAVTLRIRPRIPDQDVLALNDIGRGLGAGLLSSAPNVFLIDDDARLRALIRELLEEEGITVVGEAGSAGAAIDQLAVVAGSQLVALVDVRMPGLLNGIELTRVLARFAPEVRVVMFTGFPEPGIEQAAREAGAVTVVHKGDSPSDLLAAIRRAWVGAPR